MNRTSTSKPNVLFICGSLRKESLNRQMGEFARTALGEAVNSHWLEYSDLPYMNQDIEFPTPAIVQRVRDEVKAADAIWVCSPEYNQNIPGVLKNCLDWLSRPIAPDSKETVMQGKLVTFSCAGGGAVARYVAAALANCLAFLDCDVILTEHTQVALNRQDYTTNVLELSSTEKQAIETQARIFLERLQDKKD